MSELSEIKFYFAYTSPYSYLAWAPAHAIEQSHHVRLRAIPFGVNIRRVYGASETRSESQRNKVRYLYTDARRIARERGLTILPPRKIYSARLAFYAGLYAQRAGKFRPYSDQVFERFWKHELDVENSTEIDAILNGVGIDSAGFHEYAANEARRDLDACFAQANRDGVFGVPTFVIDGELFWGSDRIAWAIGKLDAMRLRRG